MVLVPVALNVNEGVTMAPPVPSPESYGGLLQLESMAVHCTFTQSPFASVPLVTEMPTAMPTRVPVGELLIVGAVGAVFAVIEMVRLLVELPAPNSSKLVQ